MRQALNLDVLCLICDSLHDTATVLSFSLVSSSLRSVAVKRLLSMEPVGLRNERTVRGFHRFIFADAHSRFPLIRALNISFNRVIGEQTREEIVKCILDLLERAPHLESLVLPCPRQTFESLVDPRIPEAITRISTLRELCLRGEWYYEEESTEMAGIVKFTRSASCLRILHFPLTALPPTPTPGHAHSVKIDVLGECLHRLAPKLETLVLESTTILLDTKGTQYPALRSLTMSVKADHMRMDVLVHKFPALDGTLNIRSSWIQDDEPKQQQIRASNQDQQKRQSWRHLDCVMGNIPALFALGLTCPVRCFMVNGFRGDEKHHLAEVLRSTPPTHFKLSVLLDRWHADGRHNDAFRGLFPPEVRPRLTHLVLCLQYGVFPENIRESDDESVQWRPLLADIISSISALHLTHLRLAVHYSIDLTADADEDEDNLEYSKDFVRSIVDLHHEHLATELMSAIPSLQHVFMSTGGDFMVAITLGGEPIACEDWPNWFDPQRVGRRGRWFAHSAWKSSSAGVPQRLDADVRERMLSEEDLVLSDYDNFLLGFQSTWTAEETAPWPLPE